MIDMAFLVTRRYADEACGTGVPGADDGAEQSEGQNGNGNAQDRETCTELMTEGIFKEDLEDVAFFKIPLSRCLMTCAFSRCPGIMGDHNDGLPRFGVEPVHKVHDLLGGLPVQIARGFIGNEYGRVRNDGPGNGNALLLSAGELSRIMVHPVCEAHHLKRHFYMFFPFTPRKVGEQQGKLNIFKGGEDRYEVIELEDEAYIDGPPLRQFRLRKSRNIDAADGDNAAVGFIDTGDEVQESALAGTGRTHEGKKLTFGNVEGDIFEDRHNLTAPAIGFVEIFYFNDRSGSIYYSAILMRALFLRCFEGFMTTLSPAVAPPSISTMSPSVAPTVTGVILTLFCFTRKRAFFRPHR